MGLITSIRKRLWVVTVLMALALVGFIVMDMSSGRSSWFFNNPDSIGEVAGQKISWKEFQKTENVLYRNADVDFFGRKEYIWHQSLERAIFEKESKYNGIGVSESELRELEFGNNLSPIIERNFRDPNTGQVLREQLNQFQKGIENQDLPPEAKEFWAVQEKEIIKDRMGKKLENIVRNALYMPNFMVERHFEESNAKVSFVFSRLPYDLIKNEELDIKDEDIDQYIAKKASIFKNDEETRDIKYAVISVTPSSSDSAAIRKILEDKKESFRIASKDSTFIVTNLGKWDEAYSTTSEIPVSIKDSILNMNVGDVFGPYVEGGEYRLSKILGKKTLPDSVKSRHILRRVSTREEYAAASSLIDSLKTLIESGKGRFDSLAMQFSQDPGSGIKGGDLGYAALGLMVKPFNDVIFYKGETGKLYVVPTQFGLHLIQITDQKFISKQPGIRLGTIVEAIQPGDEVLDGKLSEAQRLGEEHNSLSSLEKAIDDGNTYVLEMAGNVKANDYKLGKLGENTSNTCRDIIRWAFEKKTKLGDVSPEVYSLQDPVKKYTNRFIVAALSGINPKGLPKAAAVRDLVIEDVRKDKKFEILKAKIGTVTDINGKYGEYEVKVDSASETTVNGQQIPDYGYEPDLVPQIVKQGKGNIGGPYRGESGVYVAKLLDVTTPGKAANLENFRRFYKHTASSTCMSYLVQSLKKNYKVKDMRSKFY
ncbi:MAG: peptidylprolyl isomerase [Saprospiraceae bacterium]|nr:peptidylprolyl isomerase [Candidatus Vicinibacter affinis]